MKLTKDFTLEELIHTDTGIPNVPTDAETTKLLYIAAYLLQPIRDKWGKIIVTSGYRGPKVQDELTKRGYPTSKTSQHLKAEAVDFVSGDNVPLMLIWEWACKNLYYGQCILEDHDGKFWIHLSLPRMYGQNMQAMTFKDNKYEIVEV